MKNNDITAKNIYIIGIGGTLMGGVAIMLKNAGFNIVGSDNVLYPPMSDELKKTNIKIFEGYSEKNISDDIDLVLVGNVVSKGHIEMEEVIKRNIPYISVPSFLEKYILPEYTPVVITGTHGKTTTSSLTTTVFDYLGFNPSFLIGGVHQNYNLNGKLDKTNSPFVLEGDEYDTAFYDKVPKFSHYLTKVGVVTSVEFDHADIYEDIYKLRAVFYKFISNIPEDGLLIHWDGINGLTNLLKDCKAPKLSYGFNPMSDIYCYSYSVKNKIMNFGVKVFGEDYEFTLPIVGKHNLLNALAVIGVLTYFTKDFSKLNDAFMSFIPPKRRQEEILNKKGVIVIDDFAHHPTAIRETIAAIRLKYPKKRIITLYEPRSNTSRQSIFHQDYILAFAQSDWVLITEAKPHKFIPNEKLLDVKKLREDLIKSGVKTDVFANGLDILPALKGKLRDGDVVLIMSNGSFDGIYKKIEEII